MEGVEEKLQGMSIARRARPKEPTYLLDLALQPANLLAVSCSNFNVHLHNKDTLTLVGEYCGHSGQLCGVSFAHTTPDLLYSGSADGTVRVWDVRQPGTTKGVQLFRSDPSHHFCSFGLSCNDMVLCAGTEKVDEGDSFLVFWDARKAGNKPLGVYSESHSDDITQVCFHPLEKDRLATGSTDGLVNVFDVCQTSEDEALQATFNSDSSARSVCWCGPDYAQLLCMSHDEGLHLWDLGRLETDEPLAIFSATDARSLSQLTDGGSVDYLLGGSWLEGAQKLLVVGGMNNGDLRLMECNHSGLHVLRNLQGGHTSTVRCFTWDKVEGSLITGGEDSQLLLWKQGGEEITPGKKESMKSESALKVKSRPHKKHSYQKQKRTT